MKKLNGERSPLLYKQIKPHFLQAIQVAFVLELLCIKK
jgi:hypothetical protein